MYNSPSLDGEIEGFLAEAERKHVSPALMPQYKEG